MNGGSIASSSTNAGGGGSGGSIRLAGKNITNNGSIQAKGGTPPTTASTFDGGIGGGGRVAFNYSTNLVEGSVNVGSGAHLGSKGYNTPPTISSSLTASLAYSNEKYRKRATIRYDDLVFWYPLDETSGSIAEDFSNHERNATLINMSGANRIPGKSGGALSFTTAPIDLSTLQSSGQYLDLGDWSFGGDFTFSAWVRVDYLNINTMMLMGLSNGSTNDDIMLRHTSTGGLTMRLLDTSSGTEETTTSNPVYTLGQWVHLTVTMNDGGSNSSSVKVFQNGSLFHTSSADLSPPLVKSRSEQYMGRSTSDLKYFQGDLDDLRLYDVVLTDSEISSLYGEVGSGVHYQAQALNNPTGFSATGLPTGLSINPDTGAITGHTIAVGDHNITLSASNLSGTSPSKSVILTIAPEKPLFENEPFGLATLPALNLWLDASDSASITHSSNAVSQWNDKSGNGYDATAPSGAEPATGSATINGKNVLTWSLGKKMNKSTPSGANWQDVYVVGQWTGGSTFNNVPGIFGGTTSNNSDNGVVGGNNSGAGLWFSNWTDNFYLNGTSNNGTNVVGAMSSPFLISFSKNSAVSITGYQVGADRTNSGREWKGHFGEVIAFGTKLPDSTRQQVEGYLAHKWGLTASLPNSHPYKQSVNKQPKVAVSAIGTNSATVSADLVDLGGATTSLKVLFAEPDGTVLKTPETLAGLKLWLDASELSSAVSTWSDKSGNNNSGTKSGAPSVVTNAQNGLSVMHYTGNGQYHDFSAITDIRTVFWVVSQDASANGSGFRFLLCGASASHFHNDNNGKFWGNSADNNIKSGATRMNGTSLSGHTNYPNNLSIITLKTTGNVSADRFGQDRGFSGRQWIGKLGELLIYNSALSDSEIARIEGYLAHKWGLTGGLPTSHNYKVSLPGQLGNVSTGQTTMGLSGLSSATAYNIRVQASNSAGSSLSDTISFTTGSIPNPPADLSGYRPGTLYISGATVTSTLNFSSGTLSLDTTQGYWHHTSGVHGTGVIEQKDDNGIQYKTCTFTFDSINLASGLTVKLQGQNSLILKTRNHGNINIGTNLNANGGDSEGTPSGYASSISYGLGKLGGQNGGLKNSNNSLGNGIGTGAGKFKVGGGNQ